VGREHIKEFMSAPNDTLDMFAPIFDNGGFSYSFKGNLTDGWHVPVIRHQLTRNLSILLPEMVDELNAAMKDEFDSVITDRTPC
jgi:hypothetical protein